MGLANAIDINSVSKCDIEALNIEVLSDEVDNSVLRMPGRKVAGSLVQGDTLYLLHADLIDILESHKHEPFSELFYRIFETASNLEQRLKHYIETCKASDLPVGFQIEFSVEDYRDLFEQ
ncbi:MAG: hypothetical protein KTR16_12290 [Acidiferrobacterales bacterium]|nr:hypothetical protein [Acidiferrobacterales bacterium]